MVEKWWQIFWQQFKSYTHTPQQYKIRFILFIWYDIFSFSYTYFLERKLYYMFVVYQWRRVSPTKTPTYHFIFQINISWQRHRRKYILSIGYTRALDKWTHFHLLLDRCTYKNNINFCQKCYNSVCEETNIYLLWIIKRKGIYIYGGNREHIWNKKGKTIQNEKRKKREKNNWEVNAENISQYHTLSARFAPNFFFQFLFGILLHFIIHTMRLYTNTILS